MRFVHHKAGQYGGLKTDHRHYQVWQKLKATNLDGVYPLAKSLYVPGWGRPARCLVSMLRSCLAMMLSGLISGFDPADLPGVGTFYDFQDRLLQRPGRSRTSLQRPHYRREQQDKAGQHRDKNDTRPHQNIINRLTDRILARPKPATPLAAVLEGLADFSDLPAWEQTLQAIFLSCFVTRSVELNLIDLDQLYLAGDGTKLPTWANPCGHKQCDCDNRGKKAPRTLPLSPGLP